MNNKNLIVNQRKGREQGEITQSLKTMLLCEQTVFKMIDEKEAGT